MITKILKSKIKNISNEISNPILRNFMIIIFVVAWPLILIGSSIYSLFSKKMSDSKKLSVLKETLIILLITGIAIFLYSFK